MKSIIDSVYHDLITPDGVIEKIAPINHTLSVAEVVIENIPKGFVGFSIDPKSVVFNFKSALAQLGLNGVGKEIFLDKKERRAEIKVEIHAIGPIAQKMLPLLEKGSSIGKLFAKDDRRRVHNPDYLIRMFGRKDRHGRPLLSFGGTVKGDELLLQKVQNHMVAFLPLLEGTITYHHSIEGLLPTIATALKKKFPLRDLIRLHQKWNPGAPRQVAPNELLLVASPPLHIRTAFACVVETLLPQGAHHTQANILQPDTLASGDIYELFGNSSIEVQEIPLEFFTLEPYKEHVFFQDRDQLQSALSDPKVIFRSFAKAPKPKEDRAAVFVVKGSQLLRLTRDDWVHNDVPPIPPPSFPDHEDQARFVDDYIKQHPSYAFLKAIEDGVITSQGVLFTRYFPSPLLKRMLLSFHVQSLLMAIYFEIPSRAHGDYFSQEDRALLIDLTTFGIPVYWADKVTGSILQYVQRIGKTSGLFVPLDKVETFRKATFFGIYGSNLLAGNFESELKKLLNGILEMRKELDHPLMHKETPLALVTGGGPGAMEMGNHMAKDLNILSCAHVVDFRVRKGDIVHEQKQNPYVEAKMTYRLDHLIERQAEFYLDFPIFVMGGIGTDFEYSLEELRHKVASKIPGPIVLFGEPDYWRQKITSRFKCNDESGTIKGSEWVSNCFFCIQTAEQGLKLYRNYFEGKLELGRQFPPAPDGFVLPPNLT